MPAQGGGNLPNNTPTPPASVVPAPARPLRLSLALALAPAFDRGITTISERLRVSKGAAFGIFLACMAVVTSSCLFGALFVFGGF
jgi:hypothetical protein